MMEWTVEFLNQAGEGERLDVCFEEGACRVRNGHGAENLLRIRRMALNVLQREETARLGIKNKNLLAGGITTTCSSY